MLGHSEDNIFSLVEVQFFRQKHSSSLNDWEFLQSIFREDRDTPNIHIVNNMAADAMAMQREFSVIVLT